MDLPDRPERPKPAGSVIAEFTSGGELTSRLHETGRVWDDEADIAFASMMIPHHQQAIAMSDILLAKQGVDAKVTDLATRIKTAQAPEIAQMSGWLAGWGQNPSPSAMGGMAGMDHGDGMMSQADMDALDQASDDTATKLFLTGWSSTTKAPSPWRKPSSTRVRTRRPRNSPRRSAPLNGARSLR